MLDASAASSKASEPDSDKGSCYDSEDSFLDDDELVAELEPSNMKSKIGGFFINTGTMDAEEDPAYGQLGDHYGSSGKAGGAGGGKKQQQKKKDGKQKEAKKKARDMATDHGASGSQKRQKLSDSPGAVAAASLPSTATPVPGSAMPGPDSDAIAGSIPSVPADRQPSPRGGSGRGADAKPKKKKGPPLPKIHDGIAARIEDLRRLVDSRDSQNDGKFSTVYMSWHRNKPFSQLRRARRTGLEDLKVLPDWLEKRAKKIERALRLHIAKQAEWQKMRVDTLKHMRELMAPWKLTEAQMRKIGDHDAADDEEFSKELGADLCKTLKEAGQKQLDEHAERDDAKDDASDAVSSHGNESGDEDSSSPGEHPTEFSAGDALSTRGMVCTIVFDHRAAIIFCLGAQAGRAGVAGASGSARKSRRLATTESRRAPACPLPGCRITFPATTTAWSSCTLARGSSRARCLVTVFI